MALKVLITIIGVLALQGCVVSSTVGLAGDVVEGTVKTSAFAVKTTGKAAGAVLPGGDEDKNDEARKD